MFIGRQEELNLLSSMLKKKSASIMIYGKRKVGKTTLIKKCLESSTDKIIYYECLRSTMQDNIDGFVSVLLREKVIPSVLSFSSFLDVFNYLNSLDETFNIVIDEYPYLKTFTSFEAVDSIFQSIIDNYLSNIRLFISGSHIGMMKDLLEEKNALYGRFTTTICLKELDYLTASTFYSNITSYEKVGFYSVFGGSPYVNSAIDPNKSLKQNIIDTILNPSSYIYTYAEHLLISDYTNAINAERIFFAISNGHYKYSEIESRLGIKANGNLSKQLSSLEDMEIITKVHPINKPMDKKKSYYEVRDNLLRFYYAFIYKNKSALQMIGAEAFFEEYIEPKLKTYISHRFEDIVRTYFSLCVKRSKMKGVLNIGTYYYDDSTTKQNGEFDVVLQRKDSYDIYEVKYITNPLKTTEVEKKVEQINSIKGLNIGSIGFVSTAGFEREIEGFKYINGDDLYSI